MYNIYKINTAHGLLLHFYLINIYRRLTINKTIKNNSYNKLSYDGKIKIFLYYEIVNINIIYFIIKNML